MKVFMDQNKALNYIWPDRASITASKMPGEHEVSGDAH